ncbi:hypothetical protein PSQ19_02345 [Devosia algicola]|uniref:Uncharacterized protein n=1 Tax=Devosia algicola TaxID=3026418 RepID=A0ABY7YP16_9HYPH|nr:hypothetical protein [Devosia algicola]WDR03065.1 hypothetical protein PSQ19_02345 [Devosia algicola]
MRSIFEGKGWVLENGDAACAFFVDSEGRLQQTYWGQRLPDLADYPVPEPARHYEFGPPEQRIPFAIVTGERGVFSERTIDVVAGSGLRDLALRFVRAKQTGRRLDFVLEDVAQDLEITIHVEEPNDAWSVRSRR